MFSHMFERKRETTLGTRANRNLENYQEIGDKMANLRF